MYKSMSDFKKRYTDEERVANWNKILRRRIGVGEDLFNAGIKEGAALIKVEIDGGGCPICGKTWHTKKVDNYKYKGVYYVPACGCYPTCPFCDEKLYEELVSGRLNRNGWKCTNCGWLLVDGKLERYGKDYVRTIFSKMSKRDKLFNLNG